MKPKSISYSESKESVDAIGLKSWRKAGVEIELDDVDSVEKGFEKAKDIVTFALASQVFNYFEPSSGEVKQSTTPISATMNWNPTNGTITPLPTIDYSAKEKVEKAIEDCKTPHELDLLMGDVAKYGLTKEFIEKKKTLK